MYQDHPRTNPKRDPWEQLTDDQRSTVRNNFEYAVDEVITDVADYYSLDVEHVEALFADWVAGR